MMRSIINAKLMSFILISERSERAGEARCSRRLLASAKQMLRSSEAAARNINAS